MKILYSDPDTGRRRLVVLAFFALCLGLAFSVGRICLSVLSERKAQKLLSVFEQSNDKSAHEKLRALLEQGSVSRRLGDRILRQLVAPHLYVRETYLAGHPVMIAAGFDMPQFQHLDSEFVPAIRAREEGPNDLELFTRKGNRLYYFEVKRATRPEGEVGPIVSPGVHHARLELRYFLIPQTRSRLKWPGTGSGLWRLWPEKVASRRQNASPGSSLYACQADFVLCLNVVSLPDAKPVGCFSSPELDEKMRKAFAFQVHHEPVSVRSSGWGTPKAKIIHLSNSTPLREEISVAYKDLPTDIALRCKFRDAHGNEHISSVISVPARVGEQGIVLLRSMYDILWSLPPGKHAGQWIFFSDPAVAFDDPLITNIWRGTLSFPVAFTIAPKQEQSLRLWNYAKGLTNGAPLGQLIKTLGAPTAVTPGDKETILKWRFEEGKELAAAFRKLNDASEPARFLK